MAGKRHTVKCNAKYDMQKEYLDILLILQRLFVG